MKHWVALFLLFAGSFHLPLEGKDLYLRRNQFYLGPQWCHLTRTKEGGTKQQGSLVGIQIGYDRLKRYGWYWGAEGLYAQCVLKGHSGAGGKIRSRFMDGWIEGRFGYTFQQKENRQLALTPYAGVGYQAERNNFSDPSPLHVHFKTRFTYAAVGFLSRMHLCRQVEVGCNFKAKFPLTPKCKVTHDRPHPSIDQNIKERWHYRIELPLTYQLREAGCFAISAVPFFEFRQYGYHPNFPFDFLKTQLNFWGVTLQLQFWM